MKRLLMIAAIAVLACSCGKENALEEMPQESVVYITLKNDNSVKASGAGHGVQADDNNINTLEVFVFRAEQGKDDYGMLDVYKKFSGRELSSLSNLEVKTTTGNKIIYAVANSHKENWSGITTLGEFEKQTASLMNEDVRDFVMVGCKEEALQLASSVSIAVRRLVARIQVNSIETDFEDTPYEGCSLTDVKAYLINVQGMKYFYDGSGTDLKLLNSKKYVGADVSGALMDNVLYEDIAAIVDDSGYAVPHYFYCYENNLGTETESERFTRLVIEAGLNGRRYYYPIAIKNLERNCCYSVDVKIRRPGSLDPDVDVVLGTMELALDVLGWNTLPGSVVEF